MADQSLATTSLQELWVGHGQATDTVPLLCVPHAGGGASAYRPWMRAGIPGVPWVSVVPVRLPGREQRMGEAPCSNLGLLLETALAALTGIFARPFALFGHSMGALIAFELARRSRDLAGAPVRVRSAGAQCRAAAPAAFRIARR
jgi:surfactin synthase thioesterase subunit